MMNDNPWWCPHCRVGVDNRDILQDIRHVFCGNQVIPMETLPDRDKLIAALEAQLAALKEENAALKDPLFPTICEKSGCLYYSSITRRISVEECKELLKDAQLARDIAAIRAASYHLLVEPNEIDHEEIKYSFQLFDMFGEVSIGLVWASEVVNDYYTTFAEAVSAARAWAEQQKEAAHE